MNNCSQSETDPAQKRVLVYQITRWDLFVNWLTVFLRSRLMQMVFFAAVIVNGALVLIPKARNSSFSDILLEVGWLVVVLLALVVISQCILGLAAAFLFKQRGVVGAHVIEIADEGLIERTEYNETLHKWPSICRILTLCGYLFVYVTDHSSHQIPKRCFSPEHFKEFERELRARATGLNR